VRARAASSAEAGEPTEWAQINEAARITQRSAKSIGQLVARGGIRRRKIPKGVLREKGAQWEYALADIKARPRRVDAETLPSSAAQATLLSIADPPTAATEEAPAAAPAVAEAAPSDDSDEWIGVNEASAVAGIPVPAMLYQVKIGRIRSRKKPGHHRWNQYNRADCEAVQRERAASGKSTKRALPAVIASVNTALAADFQREKHAQQRAGAFVRSMRHDFPGFYSATITAEPNAPLRLSVEQRIVTSFDIALDEETK
jgi:hypothetical protein